MARRATAPVLCSRCDTTTPSERDLVIHLVEEHAAVWASTNSFGLEDLMIPAPRTAYDDVVDEDNPRGLRRLIRRAG